MEITLELIKEKQKELDMFLKKYEEQEVKKAHFCSWYSSLKKHDVYYHIRTTGDVEREVNTEHDEDYGRVRGLNAFITKEKAEEIASKQLLFRKLQKFSDENEGYKIDWNNKDSAKFSIMYETHGKKFIISTNYTSRREGVYFHTKEIAEKAKKQFEKELIEYFTS